MYLELKDNLNIETAHSFQCIVLLGYNEAVVMFVEHCIS